MKAINNYFLGDEEVTLEDKLFFYGQYFIYFGIFAFVFSKVI